MNPRTRHARTVLRDRRRGIPPAYRLRLASGAVVVVRRRSAPRGSNYAYYAEYQVRYATLSGPWPPDDETLRECARWS